VNEPTDQATVAASTTAPPRGAESDAPVATPPSFRRRGRQKPQRSRQARVVVRKLGPWSVLKLSFLFYLCVMVVFLGAMVILYGILNAIGALDSLTRLIRDLFADRSFEIHGDWLFTRGLAIGLGLVVLWTLINVFVVFLYNLLSDIVGGIEMTLSERR
jgi:Transmembrane domain of unknown function (DUF3566)